MTRFDHASIKLSIVTTNILAYVISARALTAGATPLYSEGLAFDAAGRLTVVQEVSEGTPVQWVYGYDAMGRLSSAARNGAGAQTWAYDGNGNRVLEGSVSATHDAQDRLLTRGATSYGWDALGGRTTKTVGGQVTRYVHDGLGALTSVTLPGGTVVAYEYDGRHRRVAKRRDGVVVKRWVYDGQYRVVAEVDGAGAVSSRFVYGSQGHSPDALVRGGVTYAYVKNHLGSVKYVVEAGTGVVAQRLDYDAWGNVTADSSPGFQPFGFAGGVHDGDTGLVHFGYRDYDAVAGVWMSKDPIRLRGGLGVFAYAGNSPVRYLDPTGLELKVHPLMRWIYGDHVERELKRAIELLADPECRCALTKGGGYEKAPWDDRGHLPRGRFVDGRHTIRRSCQPLDGPHLGIPGGLL